jgi:hypothetical protein
MGYAVRTRLALWSASASGGRFAASSTGCADARAMSGETNADVKRQNIDAVCGARSVRRERTGTRKPGEGWGGGREFICSGLTSAYRLCVRTLRINTADAARDAPQGSPEHIRTAGAAARRRPRRRTARASPRARRPRASPAVAERA